jgi:hypothetical protein
MRRSSLRIAAQALVLAALLATAPPTPAEGGSAEPGRENAERSFAHFAQEWMQGIRNIEARERSKPTIRPGNPEPLVTYQGYADEFSVEVRSTGHPEAPFVGVLRYTELLYSCTNASAATCSVASSVPQAEIFRFQSGRWLY